MLASRTPLRVSFFGGGTDFEEYYRRDYGCVLSTAIDKYIYIVVNKQFDQSIRLGYKLTEIVENVDQIMHPTIREAMRLSGIENGIELSALADVPANGTGLGSSSSFLVGVLNALHTYKGKKVDAEQLARMACKIEIETLNEPIGKQDQYIAAYGGINLIKFRKGDDVSVEPVKVSKDTIVELQSRLLFFYTGISRSSGRVLKEQKQNIENKIEYLDRLRGYAEQAKTKLEQADLSAFGEMLHESWQLKRTFASAVSNEVIDRYYDAAITAGAKGGKVLGAGGGGFFMFYCEPDRQEAVRKALQPLREVNFKFPTEGSKIVFNDTQM